MTSRRGGFKRHLLGETSWSQRKDRLRTRTPIKQPEEAPPVADIREEGSPPYANLWRTCVVARRVLAGPQHGLASSFHVFANLELPKRPRIT